MKNVIFTFAALLLPIAGAAYAQESTDDWQTHTSLREVVDLTATDDAIWVATTGGIYSYTIASGEISRFTTTEGLSGLNIRALQHEPTTGAIWVGYNDGTLDRIDVQSRVITAFLDIPRASQFPDRDIRNLAITGDTLIVATGFGVVLFDTHQGEVLETFSRFGADISIGPVSDIAVTSFPGGPKQIWLAISSENVRAVAFAPLDAPNLQDPASWQTEPIANERFALSSIAGFNGRIYVGTESGLFVRNGAEYTLLDITGDPVEALIPLEDRLVGVERFRLIAIEGSGAARGIASGGLIDVRSLVQGADGNVWIGDFTEGLSAAEPLTAGANTLTFVREPFFPSGPFDGQFAELTFDQSGNLWLGGIRGTNRGFYKLGTDGVWTNYTKRFFEVLQGRPTRFEFVHADAQGNVWAGSFGGGLVQVTPSEELKFFDTRNSSLQEPPSESNTGFTIVKGIASESDGTLWVVNTGSPRPLNLRLLDNSWTSFPGAAGAGLSYERIFVDSFDQKWIVTVSLANLDRREGLLILDTGSDISDPSDDEARYFSETGSNGQGLPSTTVNSIAEDKAGRVWIGTDQGLAYFVNTGIVAQDPNAIPIWPIRSSRQQGESQFLFFGLKVNAVTVDPANNLWVGTDIGAFYVEEGDLGFDAVLQLTQDNSPLLSDVVRSIAVDDRTGEVYFSTDVGLISLKGDAIAAAEEKQDLRVYPNPVRIEEGAEPEIFIEGLLDETEVRILTASGTLVASLSARGGRVRWDGRDRTNRLVPSGMYLVAAVDQNGGGAAYGKVAIIR